MNNISIKRVLNTTLALSFAASAFAVFPVATATPASAQPSADQGLTYNPNFDREFYEQQRALARKATAEVPNLETKTNVKVNVDLRPYIKNADQYDVIVRGLPQGMKYDIATRTISGSTPWEGTYDVSVFLRGRRDRHLQSFKLKVDNHNRPEDFPRNTDNPNLNRLPHTRR